MRKMVRPWLNSTVMTKTEAKTECEQNRTQFEAHTAAHNGLQAETLLRRMLNGLGNLIHSDNGMSGHTNTRPKQAHTHTAAAPDGHVHKMNTGT